MMQRDENLSYKSSTGEFLTKLVRVMAANVKNVESTSIQWVDKQEAVVYPYLTCGGPI